MLSLLRTLSPIHSRRGTNGRAKATIVEFVAKVAKQGSPDFVPPAEHIAVFDNDGTLWAEQPMYSNSPSLLIV